MKNIVKKTPAKAVVEKDPVMPETAEVKDVTYIEGFSPMFTGWTQDQIQIVFEVLTEDSESLDVDEDALTEIVDTFTTELELRTNLKEWRLYRKAFPEGERYLLQELRLDATKPYYLTQRIFRGKQKALVALRNVRESGELE